MKEISKITVWENARRVEKLIKFRALLEKYFTNCTTGYLPTDICENTEAKEARVDINLCLDECNEIIMKTGILPIIIWTPPPSISRGKIEVNTILSLFMISEYQIQPRTVLDFCERAIGIYRSNHRPSRRRTFNPFFWIGTFATGLVELPFKFLGELGFSQSRIESSLIGRVTKGTLYLITVLAAMLTILHFLDLLEPVMQIVRGIK